MNPILPGATLGILGGGQLGRMMAMAARSLGYRVQVMDPDLSCPARFVVDACFEGSWDDARAAADLARGCDVVTLEIEQIAIRSLEAAARHAPLRPGIDAMRIIQNRIIQKDWLTKLGVPVGEYAAAHSLEELTQSVDRMGPACFVKSARGGYDGRSQCKLGFAETNPSLPEVWDLLGRMECVVEKAVGLQQEISVMAARSPSGETRCFPSARNHHEDQILMWSVIPSSIAPALEAESQAIASRIADAIGIEGLLCVEMFLTSDGRLLVNELAPRPHNSYHASERACETSQFEQAVRAVCDLPLGGVDVVCPAAIANLLGDLWMDHDPHFDAALAVPGVHLHLYEKRSPRKGRKMGHLSSVGRTPDEAVSRVLEALGKL